MITPTMACLVGPGAVVLLDGTYWHAWPAGAGRLVLVAVGEPNRIIEPLELVDVITIDPRPTIPPRPPRNDIEAIAVLAQSGFTIETIHNGETL